MLLDECREYWKSISYCGCYSSAIKSILDKATDCLYFVASIPDEDAGAAILNTPDGFYAIEESQDYTGHGCQCGSAIGNIEEGPFSTLEDCIRLGLGVATRAILGVSLPDDPKWK